MSAPITLDREDAAKALGIGVSTLDAWTRAGYVPSIHDDRWPGVRLYSVRALERWAEEASSYEETRRGKAAGMGSRVGLQADWGQPLGGGRSRQRKAARPVRLHGEGGAANAG